MREEPFAVPLIVLLALAITAAALTGVFPLLVPVLAGAIGAAALWAARPDDRRFLVILGAGAFLLRVIALSGLDLALSASSGAMFLDDARYIRVATALADSWRAIPMSEEARGLLGDRSIASGYVWFAAAAVWLFGDIASVKVLNTALAVVTGILVYRTSRNVGLPGGRLAALLVILFPSLVLWSSLALKDAYAIALMSAAVWTATEVVRGGRLVPWLLVSGFAIYLLHDVRSYLFLMLATSLPLAMALSARGRRIRATVVASTVAAALIVIAPPPILFGHNPLFVISITRSGMAWGARSAYVDPGPVARGEPGARFVVQVPGTTPNPERTPTVHQVVQGTQLVVAGSSSEQLDPSRPVVTVQPGDIVVISAAAGASPSPVAAEPSPLSVPVVVLPGYMNLVGEPEAPNGRALAPTFQENLRHLPEGLIFLLLAPFPLFARQPGEFAAAPEMVLWYLCWILVAVALIKLIRLRRFEYSYGVLMFGGLVLVFSLTEGNVGTLVRHRTMLVPFVGVLAAAGALEVLRWQGLPWRFALQRALSRQAR